MIKSVLNYFRREKGVFVMVVILALAFLSMMASQQGAEEGAGPSDDIYSKESRLETTSPFL